LTDGGLEHEHEHIQCKQHVLDQYVGPLMELSHCEVEGRHFPPSAAIALTARGSGSSMPDSPPLSNSPRLRQAPAALRLPSLACTLATAVDRPRRLSPQCRPMLLSPLRPCAAPTLPSSAWTVGAPNMHCGRRTSFVVAPFLSLPPALILRTGARSFRWRSWLCSRSAQPARSTYALHRPSVFPCPPAPVLLQRPSPCRC